MFQVSPDHQKSAARLLDLLREFDTAMLVTHRRDGTLHARPLSIARLDDDMTIWFVTSVSSDKAEELAEDTRAMLTLQDATRFACLNGNASLVFDPARIRELWKEEFRMWFQGEQDPQIVVLRFTAFDAEYWDKSGLSGLKQVFRAARAYVSGEPLDPKPEQNASSDEHAQLRLWGPSLHDR